MRWMLVVLVLAIAGCSSLTGSSGADTWTTSGQLSSEGRSVVTMPKDVGDVNNPPVLSVYISDAQTGPYYQITTGGFAFGSYYLVQIDYGSGGAIELTVYGEPNWFYRVVAVY